MTTDTEAPHAQAGPSSPTPSAPSKPAARPARAEATDQTRFALRLAASTAGRALARAGHGLGTAARAVGRFAAPVTSTITTMGWLVIVAALVSFVIAAVLDWVEFVYLGATLAAALLVALPFVFGRMRFDVAVELEPHRVVAGCRALGRLLVTSTAPKGTAPAKIELPVGEGVAEFVVPSLASGAEHEELFAVPTHRRAVIVAGPAVSVRGDQLGLLRRAVRWNDPVELFVHPVTARLKPSAAGLVRDLEGTPTRTITDHDISFHALRPYEPGDPLRNVHWRSSARTGQLMVRQYEESRRSQLVLMLSTDESHYADDDEFELAVSVFASIGVQVVRDRTQLAVATEHGPLSTTTVTALLDDTSRITPTSGRHASIREFAREATRRLAPASVAMIVTGSGAGLADVRAAETVFGPETQLVAVRVERGAPARLGRIAETVAVTVGELSELSALMRRAHP
ncbi:DUF58 domain-containing protein [Agromyces endophyticus]|uniref:DUF58 domain-containing protein n=1 Tax=Agromyces sp. H17E-10 TaxID=2932244 RepID=UPI001FD22264|nr:DUF58 domain-containing protein [Agromyces sp. H17E-10]UOQ88821.1 DUF58 domain-containing protein [Agromyces sp. H17E-10]